MVSIPRPKDAGPLSEARAEAGARSSGDSPATDVTVTEAVRTYLAERLQLESGREACFRLSLSSGQKLTTTITDPAPGDALVPHEGRVVLAIAPQVAAWLSSNTIDMARTDDGRHALVVL